MPPHTATWLPPHEPAITCRHMLSHRHVTAATCGHAHAAATPPRRQGLVFLRIFSFTKELAKEHVLKPSFKNLQKSLASMDLITYKFTKDFLKEMEAGTQKWSQNGSKSGPKTGPPLGSPDAQKHKEFKWFWSFSASQRGPVLESFRIHLGLNFGTSIFGHFPVFIQTE